MLNTIVKIIMNISFKLNQFLRINNLHIMNAIYTYRHCFRIIQSLIIYCIFILLINHRIHL